MSDAKVEFETIDYEFAQFKRDGQNQNGGIAQWNWDSDRERPTFKPSINCGGCWHGYIEKGRCVDTSRNDEPEPPCST